MTKFVPNRDFPRQWEATAEARVVFGELAEQAASNAADLAMSEAYDTGAYLDGIEADAGRDERGRLVGRVVAKDWKSALIEFGGLYTPAKAILRRAVESLGVSVRDERRS